MSLRRFMLAGVAALALGSCATPQAPLTAQSLLYEPYVQPAAAPFDVAAFFGALPDFVEVTFDNSRFDPASGAMVVSNLVLAPRGAPQFRLRADSAEIWGGDTGAIEALMAGGVADGAVQVFDRISLSGVRTEGLQRANGAQSTTLSIDKLVYDGLSASSIAVATKDGAPEAVGFVQTLAALAGAVSLHGAAYSNMTLRLNESGGSEVLITIAEGFARGYDRGRMAFEQVDGLYYSTRAPLGGSALTEVVEQLTQDRRAGPEDKILQPGVRALMDNALKNPIALIAARAGGMNTEQHIESMTIRNVDIAGALYWLSKWELPPVTETELMDFGSISMIGERQIVNGTQVASTGRIDIPSYDFYWLVPSKITVNATDFSVALVDYMDSLASESGLGLTPETGSLEYQEARKTLLALGLDQISGDYSGGWQWDGASGALNTGFSTDVVDLAAMSFGLQMDGPSLVEWQTLAREDAPVKDLETLATLGGFNASITDYQLLDRLFAYAAAENGGTPEDFRLALPATLRLIGAESAEANPRIASYFNAVADFIAQGGSLDVAASPEAPVPLRAITTTGEKKPDALPDLLNLSITHQPQ